MALKPSGKAKAEVKKVLGEVEAEIKKAATYILKEVWKLDQKHVSPGDCVVGILTGESASGVLQSKSIPLKDGVYYPEDDLSEEMKGHLRAAGFQKMTVGVADSSVPEEDVKPEEIPEPVVETNPEPPEVKAENNGTELTGVDDIEKATWTLRHPDTNQDGVGPSAEGVTITIDGVEKKIDLVSGYVTTDDPAIKQYLLDLGYTLSKTVPKE